MVRSMIFVLAFLFSINSFAAVNPSGVPNMSLGGTGNISASSTGISLPASLQIDASNPLGYFSLFCGNTSFTTTKFYPCFKNGVAYQVSSGKTAECTGITVHSNVTAQGQLCSATAAITPGDTSITGGVYQGGAAGNYMFLHQTAGTSYVYGVMYSFGAQTYPCVQAAMASNVYTIHMTCREK